MSENETPHDVDLRTGDCLADCPAETPHLVAGEPPTDGDNLLDAMGVEVPQAIRVEEPDPEPPREFFRCKKGHVTEGIWTMVARKSESDPDLIADSGPICRVCYAQWMGRMFPAKACPAPSEN